MKIKTKVGTSIVAVALSVVSTFTAVNTFGRKGTVTEASVRTVQLEIAPQYETYLTGFNEKEIGYDDKTNEVSFHGVMDYDENVLSMFDKVSLSEEVDVDTANIVYDCSFDMAKMQFTFVAKLLDENDEVVEIEEMVTDAFVTEMGGLDAYIEIGDETYLLSDYMSAEALDNCFWWIVAIVVTTVIVTYVVVAETAEQIKAEQNYEYNKSLESSGAGVSKGNYITNQEEKTRDGYKSAKYGFGFTEFSGVGCEVASVYNLLIALGRSEMLSETIYNFEKWAIEFAFAWGALGSNPKEIYRYLNKRGILYTTYTSYDSLKNALAAKQTCNVIMSSWNNGGMLTSIFSLEGLHTYYFRKETAGCFTTYNLRYGSGTKSYPTLDAIYAEGGDFIVAYVI